jgi:hypothetical protein
VPPALKLRVLGTGCALPLWERRVSSTRDDELMPGSTVRELSASSTSKPSCVCAITRSSDLLNSRSATASTSAEGQTYSVSCTNQFYPTTYADEERLAIHLYFNTFPHLQAPSGHIRGYWSGFQLF